MREAKKTAWKALSERGHLEDRDRDARVIVTIPLLRMRNLNFCSDRIWSVKTGLPLQLHLLCTEMFCIEKENSH